MGHLATQRGRGEGNNCRSGRGAPGMAQGAKAWLSGCTGLVPAIALPCAGWDPNGELPCMQI
jgi:hypothetical protein